MLARSADAIPTGAGWRYEPKWDGFRTIVVREGGAVEMRSRDGRPLDRYFPELVEVLGRGPGTSFVMDGEIVLVLEGRLEFGVLQLRLHPAASRIRKLSAEIPATFVAFDLLELDGRDLRPHDTDARRRELERLVARLGGSPPPPGPAALRPGPGLVLTPRTEDPEIARRWFEDVEGFGQDGIVARRAEQPYVEGERAMVKVKHRRTADCVVGGYRLERRGEGVASLLLGLYDEVGVLHYVGHASAFPARQRRELRERLRPLEGGSSFGGGRSPGGPSRWSAGREAGWIPVRPELVCEVEFDRLQEGRFRHAARFLRWRPDRDPRTCTYGQLGAGGSVPPADPGPPPAPGRGKGR